MKKYIFNDNKIVIASHNKGKIKEIKVMLNPLKIEVLSAGDFNLKDLLETDEDGDIDLGFLGDVLTPNEIIGMEKFITEYMKSQAKMKKRKSSRKKVRKYSRKKVHK